MKNNNIKKMTLEFGESAAIKYLKDSGYELIHRKYKNRIGDLDIVCKKDSLIHAVEVKTIVSTDNRGQIKAEDHLDPKSIIKMIKTAALFSLEQKLPENQKISIDAMLVRLFKIGKTSKEADVLFPRNIEKVTVMHIKNIDMI